MKVLKLLTINPQIHCDQWPELAKSHRSDHSYITGTAHYKWLHLSAFCRSRLGHTELNYHRSNFPLEVQFYVRNHDWNLAAQRSRSVHIFSPLSATCNCGQYCLFSYLTFKILKGGSLRWPGKLWLNLLSLYVKHNIIDEKRWLKTMKVVLEYLIFVRILRDSEEKDLEIEARTLNLRTEKKVRIEINHQWRLRLQRTIRSTFE